MHADARARVWSDEEGLLGRRATSLAAFVADHLAQLDPLEHRLRAHFLPDELPRLLEHFNHFRPSRDGLGMHRIHTHTKTK